MKDTCKQAIFRKDTRRARRVEDPLREGDQEERELEFFNKEPNYSDLPVQEHDWSRTVYGNVKEEIPTDIPNS